MLEKCFESRFKVIFSFQCCNWFTEGGGESFNRVETSSSQGSKSNGHLGEEISRRCAFVRVLGILGLIHHRRHLSDRSQSVSQSDSQSVRQTDRQGQGGNLIGRKRGERRSEGRLSDRVEGQGPHADPPLSLPGDCTRQPRISFTASDSLLCPLKHTKEISNLQILSKIFANQKKMPVPDFYLLRRLSMACVHAKIIQSHFYP